MELKSKSTFQDKVEIAVIIRKMSGVLNKDNKRRRIICGVFSAIGLLYLFSSIKFKNVFLFICSILIIIYGMLNIIFAEKINIRNIKRNVTRYYKIACKKYNYDFAQEMESTVRINDESVEVGTVDSITKYFLNDYVRSFTEGNYHFYEFKNGKYIIMSKDDFKNEETLKAFEAAISKGCLQK